MTEDKPASKPVDTISIKREVLQGVRDALKSAMEWIPPRTDFSGAYYPARAGGDLNRANKALASLDAVLEEGES